MTNIKKYPKLFKKTNVGALQEWYIRVEKCYGGYGIITEFGQKDGKIQKTIDVITEGKNIGKKNSTDAKTQAEAEAFSKWEKKQKTGYTTEVQEAVAGEIGKFVQAGIKPMLAKNFKDFKDKIKYPVILDRKYNGGRLIATRDGLFTRKGEKYKSIPHIERSLQLFFKKYPNAILDGEAYQHEYRYKLNEIMSLIRRTKNISDEDLNQSEKKVKYYIYDGYGFDATDINSSLFVRRAAIKKHLKNIEYITLVEGTKVSSENELYKIYDEYLQDGYEGGIVRIIDSPYECKRSKYLLKVKPEDDAEGIILDINEGIGIWKGTGKVISLKWKDKEFNATFKGSVEEATKFLKEKDKWIGRKVTFLYNNLTGYGVPNFARIDINNCLKN